MIGIVAIIASVCMFVIAVIVRIEHVARMKRHVVVTIKREE